MNALNGRELPEGSGAGSRERTLELEIAQEFLGEHPLIRRVRAQAVKFMDTDLPVLITGETGCGKDMLAFALHRGSRRKARHPEIVTAAGLGETAWSVLFGHEKGAFTGAHTAHTGVFLAAHGSSVLMEDVADLPLSVQPVLLRAVEHGRFRPLGASAECAADFRFIASTNRPLDHEVEKGRFRSDLYERLAVLRIVVPPLRHHLEDIAIYAPHFLRRARDQGFEERSFSDSGLNALLEYSWPRNVRELENVVYRGVVEVAREVIDGDTVRCLLEPDSKVMRDRLERTARIDHLAVHRVLMETGGNKREAARRLGIAPNTLYRLLRQSQVCQDELGEELGAVT